ncbi:MAG: hypothetical protein IV100_02450 [Myxococcales bacterium]|nr:hypothetical protein [Myxococcales bacterium]
MKTNRTTLLLSCVPNGGAAIPRSRLHWATLAAALAVVAGCDSTDLVGVTDVSDDLLEESDAVVDFSDTPGAGDGADAADDATTLPGDDTTDDVSLTDVLADDVAAGEDTAAEDVEGDASDDDDSLGGDTQGGEDAGPGPASVCTVTPGDASEGQEAGPATMACVYETKTLDVPVGFVTEPRDVLYALPLGAAPKDGWPVAILFHGTAIPPEYYWDGAEDDGLGHWNQLKLVKSLIDAGFAVLTPRAEVALGYWNTNVPPWALSWSTAPDHQFMLDLIAAIGAGDFGPLDADRLYPSGISSGGFMASRVATTYPGVKALAVHSAAYANCGSICFPPAFDAEHPPSVFLHGALDAVVLVSSMEAYRDALVDAGVETETVIDPDAGHEWIGAAPESITSWFLEHP